FKVSINGGADTTVTVPAAITVSNNTVSGLVSSINAALTTAGLNTKIQAFAINNRVAFKAIDSSVTAFKGTASSGNPAVTQVGLSASAQNAVLQAVGTHDLPALWGRLSADTTFSLNLNGGGDQAITITQDSTRNNRFTFDIVNEVQAAIDAKLGAGKVT